MTATPRRTNWASEVDAYLLGGIGAMLLRKALSNELVLYIHPQYTPLVVATGIILLVLAVVKIWGANTAHGTIRGRAGVYALLLVPVTLSVLIPAMPVGSNLVDAQQINAGGPLYGSNQTNTTDTAQWDLLDWMYARYSTKDAVTDGKPVDVVGFVFREPDQAADVFTVVRYTLFCCVADRRGVFLPVRWDGAHKLQKDQWVNVRGTILTQPNNGVTDFTVVQADVQPVVQPATPYLYR